MKNGAILLIFDPRVMNEVTDPPIIRVRLSNDVIKSHFRLAAIDLDMKNRSKWAKNDDFCQFLEFASLNFFYFVD